MIVIRATMRIKQNMDEPARSAFGELMKASQTEEGCIAYSFTADIVEPGLIHVTEIWETKAALHAHFATDAFGKFMSASSDLVDPTGMNAWSGELTPYELALV